MKNIGKITQEKLPLQPEYTHVPVYIVTKLEIIVDSYQYISKGMEIVKKKISFAKALNTKKKRRPDVRTA